MPIIFYKLKIYQILHIYMYISYTLKAVIQNQTMHLNEGKEHREDDRMNPGLKEGILNITTNIKCPFVLFNFDFLIVFSECCP